MIRHARPIAPDARRIAADLARRVREKRLALLRSYATPRIDAADLAPRFLDDCICGLAREEARCRLVLGRLLEIVVAKESLTRLGFVRLADYARERLGISGSEAKVTRHVVTRLARLALLRSAFLEGKLSWTKARLLVAVASPQTEAHWLEVAADHTVRELEAIVAREGAAAKGEAATVREDDDLEIDGEPRARFRLRVPGWAWILFRQVVELARVASGEGNLPVWQAVEAITGEAAAIGATADPRELVVETARRTCRRRARLRLALAARGSAAESTASWSADEVARVAEWLGRREEELRFVEPEAVERFETNADAASPADLDQRLRGVLACLHRVDVKLGRALHLVAERRLHRSLGFFDFESYVVERVGMSLRKARSLLALDRAASENAVLRRGYESGEISWVRAITLLPLIRAGAFDAAWVERASHVTVRRLADEVGWSLERLAAGNTAEASSPPPLGSLLEPVQMRVEGEETRADHLIEFWGPISVVATLDALIAAWCEAREPRWKGLIRVLAAVARQWQGEGKRFRDPVVRRDGYRCVVPACSSRRNLQVHHIVFRSTGGNDEQANLATLCAGHHLRCLHSGTIRATGIAPDEIEWELGVRADGPPLLRLRGDVYAFSVVRG